jgi:hypothetical protein
MSWIGLPPGNILQQLYLKERVNFYKNKYQYRKFLEIGSGNGHISYVLLNNRNVPFKTTFPKILNLILNPIVLYPFHILQKLFLNQLNHSLVLYFEIKNK